MEPCATGLRIKATSRSFGELIRQKLACGIIDDQSAAEGLSFYTRFNVFEIPEGTEQHNEALATRQPAATGVHEISCMSKQRNCGASHAALRGKSYAKKEAESF